MLDAFEQSVPCILSFDTALVICPGVKECQVSGSRFLRNFRHIERYHIRPNPPEVRRHLLSEFRVSSYDCDTRKF